MPLNDCNQLNMQSTKQSTLQTGFNTGRQLAVSHKIIIQSGDSTQRIAPSKTTYRRPIKIKETQAATTPPSKKGYILMQASTPTESRLGLKTGTGSAFRT